MLKIGRKIALIYYYKKLTYFNALIVARHNNKTFSQRVGSWDRGSVGRESLCPCADQVASVTQAYAKAKAANQGRENLIPRLVPT
jgi:hypothetical protein